MISKILVFSRTQVACGIQLFNDKKYGLISINHEPHGHLLNDEFVIIKKMEKVPKLSLYFSDCTLAEYNKVKSKDVKDHLYLFNEDHAKQIVNFVTDNKDKIDLLIIHCEAGQSRSGAVGLWANRYLGLNEKQFLQDNKKIFPNAYVYNMLYVASGMKESYNNFWSHVEN
jgi:hypothetical protein